MGNIDLIVLTTMVVIAFGIFIVKSIKEFTKMDTQDYSHNTRNPKFGRDAVYNMLERLFNDANTKTQKADLIKTIDRTISDMESDGVYFSEEVKQKLEKEREDLFCEYSGLPSPMAYNTIKK